jgi:RNA polymerase II-associated protein 1
MSEDPDVGDWRLQISEENERRVARMTEEERGEARRDIEEKFGKNIGDVLRKVRMAREAKQMEKRAAASLDSETTHGQPDANSSVEPSPGA